MTTNEIPPMTDPLGKHWRQPATSKILIDEKFAVMDQTTFEALSEYSTTTPSGVYIGKMWRARIGLRWFLRWYGVGDEPGYCSNHSREILLVSP